MNTMASQITGVSIVGSGPYQEISKLRVTGLCGGKSPMAGEFLAQKARDVENVST